MLRSFKYSQTGFYQQIKIIFFILIIVVSFSAGCDYESPGPRKVISKFFVALSEKKYDIAAKLTDMPDNAILGWKTAIEQLNSENFSAIIDSITIVKNEAQVTAHYTWGFGNKQYWRYKNTLLVIKNENNWKIRWSNAVIHPLLGEDQSLIKVIASTEPAAILDNNGLMIYQPSFVDDIYFDKSVLVDKNSVVVNVSKIISILKPIKSNLSIQKYSEIITATKDLVKITRLNHNDYLKYKDDLLTIPGVKVIEIPELIPAQKNLDTTILESVKTALFPKLLGQPGWHISTATKYHHETATLVDFPALENPAVKLTLSLPVQQAAQTAVEKYNPKGAILVAIQPSTGKILAIAHNRTARIRGWHATTGLFPPGSTFKIVTATAALQSKKYTSETIVPCPGDIDIGNRNIPNYSHFSLGNVPLRTAFANSCNTTFAQIASKLPLGVLTRVAKYFGIGIDYDINELISTAGKVPFTKDKIMQAEDGFGQGEILVTPLIMSIVAATIARAAPVIPYFLDNSSTQTDIRVPDLALKEILELRKMMRQVVTSGTAISISDQGKIYGKTGEAEVKRGSHSWFVGYKGDLAFAVIVVYGGGSETAVTLTKNFLQQLN